MLFKFTFKKKYLFVLLKWQNQEKDHPDPHQKRDLPPRDQKRDTPNLVPNLEPLREEASNLPAEVLEPRLSVMPPRTPKVLEDVLLM